LVEKADAEAVEGAADGEPALFHVIVAGSARWSRSDVTR